MGIFTKIFGKSSTPKPQQEQRTSATTGAPSENKTVFQPFSFHSDCHQRYNNDVPEGSLQVCGRSIKVEKNTNGCSGYNLTPGDGYIVRATNDDTGKPQFAPKPMRIVKTSNNSVLLRGYKTEAMSPFGWIDFDGDDYGFEVFYENGNVTKCVLYMYDRNVRLEYMRQLYLSFSISYTYNS